MLLRVEKLRKSFRGLDALQDYDLALQAGELLGVIGPNGAGKTTLFNLLTGIIKPSEGKVLFADVDITGWKPEQIARRGIARTFQKVRLFQPLTALENVRVALQAQQRTRLWEVLLMTPTFNAAERKMTEEARGILHLLELDEVADKPAQQLTYGQQRRLEIACTLALSPQLLLLDEPAAGMNPTETEALMHLIRRLHDQMQLAIILIEHNMHVIMNTCQRIQVLNYGKIIAEGDPETIRNDDHVIEAYLGQAAQHA